MAMVRTATTHLAPQMPGGGGVGQDGTGTGTCADEAQERSGHLTPPLSPVCTVPLDALTPASSPRLRGVDEAHVRFLAESDAVLPPVVVHRGTMRVIDGVHRLRAASLRGRRHVPVRYFEGAAEDAFVFAVENNVRHGLPLSLAERTAAAARILRTYPHLSDRTLASTTGLSARTVRAVRKRVEGAAPDKRIGRDGRARPLSTADARRRASVYLAQNPDASLREVAGVTGLSPGTVRDVRDRARRGEDPVPPGQRSRRVHVPEGIWPGRAPVAGVRCVRESAELPPLGATERSPDTLLRKLSRDPSLRFTENGRHLLRMMSAHLIAAERREQLAQSVPAHCAGTAADLARQCSQAWAALACHLEHKPTT